VPLSSLKRSLAQAQAETEEALRPVGDRQTVSHGNFAGGTKVDFGALEKFRCAEPRALKRSARSGIGTTSGASAR
jgi:hypothetical protein